MLPTAWKINLETTQVYFALPDLVVADNRKVSDVHATAPARSGGASLLTTARAGSVSLCFKYHKAQTFRLLAPGCEDELSGLDPANTVAFNLSKAIPRLKTIREARTLSTTRRTYDKDTYWKRYVPRTSIDKLCEGTKKNGQPCQKLAEPGGRYCRQHGRHQ